MTFCVFISHAYDQRKLYNSIVYRFEDQDQFDWYDCSVPRHRRYGIDGSHRLTDEEIRELLKEHINRADVVIAIAKPVASRREWLRWEIEYAKSIGKPVIAVWRRNVDKRFELRTSSRRREGGHLEHQVNHEGGDRAGNSRPPAEN